MINAMDGDGLRQRLAAASSQPRPKPGERVTNHLQRLVPDGFDNDTSGGPDVWEQRVWFSAVAFGYFTTARRNRMSHQHTTFPEAVLDVYNIEDGCVYAVSKNGRTSIIPRSRWLFYLRTYNEIAADENDPAGVTEALIDGLQEHATR